MNLKMLSWTQELISSYISSFTPVWSNVMHNARIHAAHDLWKTKISYTNPQPQWMGRGQLPNLKINMGVIYDEVLWNQNKQKNNSCCISYYCIVTTQNDSTTKHK